MIHTRRRIFWMVEIGSTTAVLWQHVAWRVGTRKKLMENYRVAFSAIETYGENRGEEKASIHQRQKYSVNEERVAIDGVPKLCSLA